MVRRTLLAIALLLPGSTHVVRGRRLLLGCVLFVLGVGAGLNLMIASQTLDSGLETFSILEAISTVNMLALWPIASAEVSGEPSLPVLAEGDRWPLQPHFRSLVAGHILLFVLAAAVSAWCEWRQATSGPKP
jgi:hypothetical protein